MTREQWLLAGVELFRPRLPDLGPLKVSVGFPKGGRKHLGQCWSEKVSADQKTMHIFVSPSIDSGVEALRTLLHELVHAAVGVDKKHGREFSQLAKKLGFEKPWTQTPAGEALKVELAEAAEELGSYPHIGLEPPRKQTTRLKLWECACEPPVKIRRAGELNAKCLDCGQMFVKREA